MFVYSNKNELIEAIKDDPFALEYALDKFKDMKTVVEVAVKRDGWTLAFASERLKNDKGLVMLAVSQNGKAFQFASKELQHDLDVACEAYNQNQSIINLIPREIRSRVKAMHKEYVNHKEKEAFLKQLDEKLKMSKYGVYPEPLSLDSLKKEWLSDEKFIIDICRRDYKLLCQIHNKIPLFKDKKFLLKLAEINYKALCYMPVEILDAGFCRQLVGKNYRSYVVIESLKFKNLDYDKQEKLSILQATRVSLKEEINLYEKDRYSNAGFSSVFPHGYFSEDFKTIDKKIATLKNAILNNEEEFENE